VLDLRESRELAEATMRYVASLKLAYPDLDERDLYRIVYEISHQRVEAARDVGRNR
jgi:hypothetical protein